MPMFSEQEEKHLKKACYELSRVFPMLFVGLAVLFALLTSWGLMVLHLFLAAIFYGLHRLSLWAEKGNDS